MTLLRTLLVLLCCMTAAAQAQQVDDYERIDLRVISVQANGRVGVDHGSSDGLAVGDMVLFFPRDGGTFGGNVSEVNQRGASVELMDPGAELPLGTRGQALVPRARLQPAVEDTELQPAAPELLDLPWSNSDSEWSSTMPLLSNDETVRPEDRMRRIRGRLYMTADSRYTSFEDRLDSFYRVGQDLSFENPFGRGGGLNLDTEQNFRRYLAKDGDEEDRSELRIDRLSYSLGGTRFDPTRIEGGRFLQHGMPEFGVVDGAEIGRRLSNGDHVGASVGYMPDPLDNFETGEDLQVSAFYRFVADEGELFTLAGGYQKSFHEGDSDRDLFLAQVRYLPTDAWQFHGTAWIDHYGSGEDAKGAEFALTQAILLAQRRWTTGNGLSFTYNRSTFPEIERQEFLAVAPTQVARDHHDRLAARAWRWMGKDHKLHSSLGGWSDEDESGADGEFGLEAHGFLLSNGYTDVTVFGTEGRFESIVGGRVTLASNSAGPAWSLMYEGARVDVDGALLSPADDLFQHRVRANKDWYASNGFVLSTYAESFFWDEEDSWMLGFHMQRSF